MAASDISTVPESKLFDLSVVPSLEKSVQHQIDTCTYDARINRALLRMYNMYPKLQKDDMVVKVLAKGLMALSDAGFILTLSLVPLAMLKEHPQVKALVEAETLLQSGKFAEFWAATQASPLKEVVEPVPGFADAVRDFIITAFTITYTQVSSAQLQAALNVPSLDASIKVYNLTTDGDMVVMPRNAENTARPKRFEESVSFDRISGMMHVLAQ